MSVERRGPAVGKDSTKKEGKGEMTKTPISLQDLRRSLYLGLITLDRKPAGKPIAGNRHDGFEAAVAGNQLTVRLVRHSQRKQGATDRLNLRSMAPVLDPTTPAAAGEDGRQAGETRPLLLVVVGGESFDATAVCQHAGADRWTAASVGIAEAAAPKKRIPLSTRNGELSEKAGLGCRGDRLSGPGKGRLGTGGTVWEKNPARRSRLEANGCVLATAGKPKN
jgi:hypothetical protein